MTFGKMHLVLVSSLVPVDNPASGFDIANRAVLDGLVALGHRVSVVGFLQPGRKPAPGCEMQLLGELEVTNAKVGRRQKLSWLATAFLNRTSVSSAKMLGVSAGRIQSILDGLAPFDGVVLNSVQLPAAFAQVFRRYPSIYVAHNVEADSALENAERATGAFERFLFRREASSSSATNGSSRKTPSHCGLLPRRIASVSVEPFPIGPSCCRWSPAGIRQFCRMSCASTTSA